MNNLTPLQQQRERTIEALIDEQYGRAIAKGAVIAHPDAWRRNKRTQIIAQAKEHPGWLRQQSDRIYGDQKRPGKLATCPHCQITFDPNHDGPTVLTFSEPTHPRWMHPAHNRLVAVAPEHVRDYQRLGWKPIPDVLQPLPTVIADDTPTRGGDGLLYCRPGCARLEPFIRRPIPPDPLDDDLDVLIEDL